MNFEAVIFDFGGVLLDIDYAATVEELAAVLGIDLASFYSQHRQSPLFDDIETGKISEAEFYAGLEGIAGRSLAHSALEQAWNAMLGGIRSERLAFVRQVAQRYRCFLLSNTNSIHKRAFDRTLTDCLGSAAAFDQLFERAYYSHLLGLRKPNPEVFAHLLQAHGLTAERTLFIDDSEQHIIGARKLGIQAFHLRGELLASELPQLLLS